MQISFIKFSFPVFYNFQNSNGKIFWCIAYCKLCTPPSDIKRCRAFFWIHWPVDGFSCLKTYQLLVLTNTSDVENKSRIFQNRIFKMRQTTRNEDEVVTSIVNIILDLSLTLVWEILFLFFVFIEFNTSRVGPHLQNKVYSEPSSWRVKFSFAVGAPSIWSCALKIVLAVHLKFWQCA